MKGPLSSWFSRTPLGQLGVADGCLYLLMRAAARLTRNRLRLVKYYIVAQPVGQQDTPTLRTDPNTVFEWVPPGHSLCAEFPRPAAVIARRYASGARCLAVLVKGRFAGFLWLKDKVYEEDEVRCTYRLDDPVRTVWDFDVYVEPRYRLGRTLGRLWQTAHAQLAAEGVGWTLSRISAYNRASLTAHSRLGAVVVDRLLFVKAGGFQLAWHGRGLKGGYHRLGDDFAVNLAAPPTAP